MLYSCDIEVINLNFKETSVTVLNFTHSPSCMVQYHNGSKIIKQVIQGLIVFIYDPGT